MTTILLVRHGRTAANAGGLLAGRTPGVGLDVVGRRQVRSLGTRLRGVPVDVVVRSPLERCAETSAAIVSRRSGDPVAVRVDDRLTECDYGDWTGRPLTELATEPLWEQVQRRPSEVVFPGGEAMTAMLARATASVEFWAAEHPTGVVVMVSHGDVIKAILSDSLAQPFDQFQRIVVSPASVSVIARAEGRTAVLAVNVTGGKLPFGVPGATVGGGAV